MLRSSSDSRFEVRATRASEEGFEAYVALSRRHALDESDPITSNAMSGDAPFHFVKRTNATLAAMMPQVMGLGNTPLHRLPAHHHLSA